MIAKIIKIFLIHAPTISLSLYRRNLVERLPQTRFFKTALGPAPSCFPRFYDNKISGGLIKLKNKQSISPGFSVVELMMVMAVSAIMMTILFGIYNQVMGNAQKIERCVVQDAQILTLENRLYKDFIGISAIWFTQSDLDKQRAAKDAKDIVGAINQQSQQIKKKSSSYFYSINKQSNLEMMTFVTTSALQSYGATQDRFVRIVYKIESDPHYQGNFRLMRKEILNVTEYIDDEALKAGKFYELAGNIGSFETTYHFVDVQELKKQQKAQSEKDGAPALKSDSTENKQLIRSVKEWKEEKKKKEKEQKTNDQKEDLDDLGGALVPKIIELKISFGLRNDPGAREYKLSFYIPSSIDQIVQPLKKPQVPVPAGNQSTGNNSGGMPA